MSLIKKGGLALLGLWLLLALAPAPLLKWGIEHQGTHWLGARVDIEKVAFSWWPMQVVLSGVDVTNPLKPAYNAVSLARVQAEVDVLASLQGALHVPLIQVEGITIATPRAQSGAIPGVLPRRLFVTADAEGFHLPLIDPLPMESIINTESERYRNSTDEFRQLLLDKQSDWAAKIQSLPDETVLAAYRERWQALKNARRSSRAPLTLQARERKRELLLAGLQSDTMKLQQAERELRTQWQNVQTRYADLKKQPADSVVSQVERLGVSDIAISRLGQALVREKIQEWLNTTLGIHQLLVMPAAVNNANADGQQSKPRLIIKKLSLAGVFASAALPDNSPGLIHGEILNLSDAPQWHTEPVTLNIDAGGQFLGAVQLSAMLDHRTVGKEIDRFNFTVTDASLRAWPLAWNDSLPVTVKSGRLSLSLAGTIDPLQRLDVNLSSIFELEALEVKVKNTDNDAALALVAAIEKLPTLTVTARANGELNSPALQLTTSLDEVMAAALRQAFGSRVLSWRDELQRRLDEVLMTQLAIVEPDLAKSSALLDTLQQRYQAYDALRVSLSK